MKALKMLLFFTCFILCGDIYSFSFENPRISIDINHVNLKEALQMFAKWNNINIVVSPSVHGIVSLHLKEVSPEKALDILLASHELSKWQIDNIWFISSRSEWFRWEQEKIKLNTLLEESSPLVIRTWRIHYAKVEDIANLLQNNTHSLLSRRGHVTIDTRTNTLCVQDIVEHMPLIQALVMTLDIPVQQVLIEAHLASIDSDYEEELGVNFSTLSSADNANSLAVIKLSNHIALNVQLAALEKEGHGELISSPSLFTANQQTASIESGEEIPYQEISKSGATGLSFKKAVLSLKVTPQILPDRRILLQLQVNQDKTSNRMVLGVPTINTRQITTNILIKNGQTVVLGGIYETNKENGEQRIPFLGKIPIVGWIFTQQHTERNKRELLIFVTPKIIG